MEFRPTPDERARAGPPLVTLLITAYNRPEELRRTLRALRAQTYPALELFVIDDHSPESLEPLVRAEAPDAAFRRNATNCGLVASRSLGMARARGDYILVLDDDSHPVASDAIARAVARFEREPALGVLAFRVHEGLESPAPEAALPGEEYTHAYIGCGHMLRRAMVEQVGGYRDFFVYYKEEAEYALRVLDGGWRILYFPEVVVHHRLSPVGRSEARMTAYAFRNALWTVLLTAPARRLPLEAGWKFAVGGLELARRGDLRWLAWGLGSFAAGLPRVLRERRPISAAAARTYDVLRFRRITGAAALEAAEPPSWRERWTWFHRVWRTRRRARPFWDRREGGVGEGTWTTRHAG